MIKGFVTLLVTIFSINVFAVVNMKNANYSESWTDIIVPGSGYDLRVLRTVNSRSIYSGIFGFGWCSDFETKIDVLSDGQLKLTECGGGLEVNYSLKNFSKGQTEQSIAKILEETKKRNPNLTKAEFDSIKSDVESDSFFREALAERLGIKSQVSAGQVYRANGVENESIKFQNNQYVRNLSNGSYQKFDPKGRLVSLYDRNGNFLTIDYSGDKITKVSDNNGRQLSFTYAGDRLAKITAPGGLEAAYKFNSEDLVEVKNQWKNSYKYTYDKLHNLTKAEYPDGTYKALTYNEDRDWVTSFRNRKGCVEKYDYQVKKTGAEEQHLSTVEKKCDGKVTNNSTYEFFYKNDSKTKASFLQRVRSTVNGKKSEYVYHPVHGRPVFSSEGGFATEYTYYDDGNVKTKKAQNADYTYEYKNDCGKVSKVVTNYFGFRQPTQANTAPDAPMPKTELLRTIKTDFDYDKRCNLLSAKNSDGQLAKLSYDLKGRIVKIEDQAKKIVNIEYESRFGKPSLVSRPGLGAMKVLYKADGSIEKVESKDGPRVIAQVSNVFNNLLEILGPASAQLSL